MDLQFPPALVLNADFAPVEYLPLSVWPWQTAVHAAISERVNIVLEHDTVIHSPTFEMRVPSVVSLREYVERKRRPSLTRYNLIVLRDRNACGYCGRTFPTHLLTFDHVIPRAQGGKSSWENIVSCCLGCNQAKRDRTPQEARMPLLWRPYLPTVQELARIEFYINARRLYDGWEDFLGFGV